jgi:hypothetical protein
MFDKDHILAEIRRTAEENRGVPLGRMRFRKETGIRESDWSGRYWARWGDAVKEAGFEPNTKKQRSDDEANLEQLAVETRRLGHLPTSREMRLRRREEPSFPNVGVFERLGPRREVANLLKAFCDEHPDYGDVAAIVQPLLSGSDNPADPGEPDDDEALGYVYLLKSGRNYKLGRTNSLRRRERELAIQLPERAETVHTIKTDDPAGIETYWHRRFADRRKNGEWFKLTQADVRAFKRRKFM